MDQLPIEIITHIFKYLSSSDIFQCSLVNRQFLKVSQSNSLWLSLLKSSDPYLLFKQNMLQSIDWKIEYHQRFARLQCVYSVATSFPIWDLIVDSNNLYALNEQNVLDIYSISSNSSPIIKQSISIQRPTFNKHKFCIGGSLLKINSNLFFSQDDTVSMVVIK